MENTKRVKIIVKQRKTSDGRTFNVYKAVTKNGVLIDCKFRKEVTNIPTVDSFITCNVSDMNMQKNSIYKVLWVSHILSVEPVTAAAASEESAAKNAAEINEIFE